jgi:hypothetical protein
LARRDVEPIYFDPAATLKFTLDPLKAEQRDGAVVEAPNRRFTLKSIPTIKYWTEKRRLVKIPTAGAEILRHVEFAAAKRAAA